MRKQIEFRSFVDSKQRMALERLLFFNACQERVAQGIEQAVDVFGQPEIELAGVERLQVVIQRVKDAQCLFAVESESGKPVGMALYIRADLEHITVLHLSIAAEYASGGLFSDELLLLRLLREVKRSTRRMKGVRRLQLCYGRSRPADWERLAAG